MNTQNFLSGLPKIFGNWTALYAARSDLARHLQAARLIGTVGKIPAGSPFLILRDLIEEMAPFNSIHLLVSPGGGETTVKTRLFEQAFAKLIAYEPTFTERLWHLMCYAGSSSTGTTTLRISPRSMRPSPRRRTSPRWR